MVNALPWRQLEAPFFQTEWQGVSLLPIAWQMGLKENDLCAADFYDAFYTRLEETGFTLADSWVAGKGRTSARLRRIIGSLPLRPDGAAPKILSVGAGLGIVELPLIREGYDIELFECQERSLGYFRHHAPDIDVPVWIGENLGPLPAASYDLVFACQVVYALPLDRYRRLLEDAARLLRRGGVLLLWEPECVFRDWVAMKLGSRPEGVFWGWQRSRTLHRRMARAAGFRPLEARSLTVEMVPVEREPARFLGMTLGPVTGPIQELLFTKP